MTYVIAIGIVGILGYLVWERAHETKTADLLRQVTELVGSVSESLGKSVATAIGVNSALPQHEVEEAEREPNYYPDHEYDNFVPGSVDDLVGMGDGWLNPTREAPVLKPRED